MSYSKVDDNTLKVITDVEIITEDKSYDFDFLLNQEIAIQKQLDDFVAAREVELVEVRLLIAEAKKLGIKGKN